MKRSGALLRREDRIGRVIRALERALVRESAGPSDRETSLQKRAAALLDAMKSPAVVVLIANTRGRYVDVNPLASRLTGYSREELLRLNVWDLTPGGRLPLGRRLWREFLARGRMAGTYEVLRKDGRLARARYVAIAHVLPGIHVSALTASRPVGRAPRSA